MSTLPTIVWDSSTFLDSNCPQLQYSHKLLQNLNLKFVHPGRFSHLKGATYEKGSEAVSYTWYLAVRYLSL